MFYGIKGYIFADEGNFRQKISNPPFEAMTGFDKLKDFMAPLLENKETPINGYLLMLIPQDKWKGEDE